MSPPSTLANQVKPGRPKKLLTQNSELKPHGIWNWTLPAYAVRLSNGKTMNVCPNAGACAKYCYALNGTYLFRNVRARHMANLEYVLNHPDEWQTQMTEEVQTLKGKYVRIHDAGDFYSADYLRRWIRIAEATPTITFYAYTKEVSMFKEHAHLIPPNFRYLFSLGGKQDHLIDPDTDRHAEVFPDTTTLEQAGYSDQSDCDLLAITLPTTKVGIPANNIKHYKRGMAGRTFGELSDRTKPQVPPTDCDQRTRGCLNR